MMAAAIVPHRLDSGISLSIVGMPSGAVNEYIDVPQALTFQVDVADPTLGEDASSLQITATAAGARYLNVGPITMLPNDVYEGVATVTYEPGQFQQGSVAISLTATTILGNASPTQIFSANITTVDPSPYVQAQIGTLSFNENYDSAANGTLSFSDGVYIDDITSSGISDAGDCTLVATSSNTALINSHDIKLANEGAGNFALNLESEAGQFGSTNVTLTASDGHSTGSLVIPVTVHEVAVRPVITAPAVANYFELSTARTISIPFSATDPNALPIVSVSTLGTTSPWLHPTLVTGANGHDTLRLVVDGYGSGTGTIQINANSFQAVGEASSSDNVVVNVAHEHLDFSIPAALSFSIPEGDGYAVLTGFGQIPVTHANNDQFSFNIVSGDPIIGGQPLYSISNTGRIYLNGQDTWQPGTTNRTVMRVLVTNGAHTHAETLAVSVTDASPPIMTIVGTTAHMAGGKIVDGNIHVTATDPHGLALQIAISNETINSGAKPYFIAGISKTGTTYNANIAVPPTAPNASVADTLTITATDEQGLQTVESIAFFPDFIGTNAKLGSVSSSVSSQGGVFSREFAQDNTSFGLHHGLMILSR